MQLLRPLKKHYTPAEYLAMEEVAEYKSEYFDGKIYAMSGGTGDHSLIQGNLIGLLNEFRRGKRKPCRVYTSDMRVLVEQSTFYTYPDVILVCGRVQFSSGRNDVLINPTLIIEVLSESTRKYDRGAKFEFYKQISSLQGYILVESTRPHVERYRRVGRKWESETYNGLEAQFTLDLLDSEVTLERIYEQVSWLE